MEIEELNCKSKSPILKHKTTIGSWQMDSSRQMFKKSFLLQNLHGRKESFVPPGKLEVATQ